MFYSEADISALAQNRRDIAVVKEDMIPEVAIKRQLPKNKVNLQQLRLVSVRGKRPGNKGRETYFYKKEYVETRLNVRIISQEDQIGIDFIPSDK